MREGADTVAEFFAEPVQGAVAVIIPRPGHWYKVPSVLRKNDIVLVADEVITEPQIDELFDKLGQSLDLAHADACRAGLVP